MRSDMVDREKKAIAALWSRRIPLFEAENDVYSFCAKMQRLAKRDKANGFVTYLQMEELLKFNTLWFWWAMKKLEG